jgi:hypothetical protein
MPNIVGYAVDVSAADGELLRKCRQKLDAGKNFRQSTRETLWRQSESQYRGNQWDETDIEDPSADLITINVSFSTVNTIMPYITGEEPQFLVTPLSYDATVRNARLQQAFLNRKWRSQKTGSQVGLEAAAVDFLIVGDGYLKGTYEIIDKKLSHDNFAEVAELYVDRIDPWDLWIDPFSDGISNARWICQRIFTTKFEMENDPVYEGVNLDDLGFGDIDTLATEDTNDRSNLARLGDSSEDWIALYEFYDITRRVMITFADTGDKPLRKVEEVLPPIVQLPNYRIPHNPYHFGELEQLWPIQQELNKTRSQLITHRRRNIAKYLIRESAIADDTEAALLSPIVGEMVPIKGDIPLDSVVRPVSVAPLAPEAYASADQALRDIYEISGVNEYQRGAAPEIRRTATEASIIEGASNVKTRAKLLAVERAVRLLGTVILGIAEDVFPDTEVDEMALFLTGAEAELIAREDALTEADAYTVQGQPELAQQAAAAGENVQGIDVVPSEEIFVGEYEVEVEPNSTELRNPVFREQKYREMALALTQNVPILSQMGVTINLRKAYELWFEAAGIADIEGMFRSPQAALQQQQPGLPPGPPGAGGVAPEEGLPSLPNAEAPLAALTAGNTGALPPEA